MITDVGLRRRRGLSLAETIADHQRQATYDVANALRRTTLDVPMARIKTLTGGRISVVGGAEARDHEIVIAAMGNQAYMRSGNFDPQTPNVGFNIRTDGRVDIANDLVLTGLGQNAIQAQLDGDKFGSWIVRTMWDEGVHAWYTWCWYGAGSAVG